MKPSISIISIKDPAFGVVFKYHLHIPNHPHLVICYSLGILYFTFKSMTKFVYLVLDGFLLYCPGSSQNPGLKQSS
jgi:hypothetical protein